MMCFMTVKHATPLKLKNFQLEESIKIPGWCLSESRREFDSWHTGRNMIAGGRNKHVQVFLISVQINDKPDRGTPPAKVPAPFK